MIDEGVFVFHTLTFLLIRIFRNNFSILYLVRINFQKIKENTNHLYFLNMIWFNQHDLENKIVNEQLTDKDGLNYFFAIFVFTAIPFSLSNTTALYHIDTLISDLILSIVTWGVISSYRANKRIDNKDFFNRFFSLSWIIGIRMILLVIISIIAINSLKGLIPPQYYCNYKLLNIILILIYIAMIWIINYLMIIKSFEEGKKLNSESGIPMSVF